MCLLVVVDHLACGSCSPHRILGEDPDTLTASLTRLRVVGTPRRAITLLTVTADRTRVWAGFRHPDLSSNLASAYHAA